MTKRVRETPLRTRGDMRSYAEIHRTLTQAFQTLLGIPARKGPPKRLMAKGRR